MTDLSQHFTYEELTVTETGLPNVPEEAEMDNLRRTANAMEAVRTLLGEPITVNSGFRCLAVNRRVGGADNSAHVQGYAVDFVCPKFGTPLEIARAIVASPIDFDQLIMEGTWVHFSTDPRMRREILTAHFVSGQRSAKTTYTEGLQS